MTIHCLSHLLLPIHAVPPFSISIVCLFSAQNRRLTGMVFSVLNSILLVVMVFPLDFSHLIVILWWVFSSTITFCPCLAFESLCFCFWASLFWVFLFFIMCFARVSSFLSDLLLMSCSTMILCGILLMCCWLWVLFHIVGPFSADYVVLFGLPLPCSSIWAICVPPCCFLSISIQLLGFLHCPYISTNPLLIKFVRLCSVISLIHNADWSCHHSKRLL